MKDKLFETSPRLFLLCEEAAAFLFFLFLAINFFIHFASVMGNWVYLLLAIILFRSSFHIYNLLSTQIIIITKTQIVLRHFFLSKTKCFNINEISHIFQNYTENLFTVRQGYAKGNMYNTYLTTLVFNNKEQCELLTVMPDDYAILRNIFDEIKNGGTNLELKRNNIKSYFEQNKDGLPILFLFGLLLTVMFCLFFYN